MKKIPTQGRAKATVGFILEAAAYILEHDGLDGFTTNRIAARAGVNISSLYQYFANKEEIIEALWHRHRTRAGDGLKRSKATKLPQAEKIKWLLANLVAVHRADCKAHAVLLDTLPRQKLRSLGLEKERTAELAAFLFGGRETKAALKAFIIRNAFLGVVHAAVCERPELLDNAEFEAQLYALFAGYAFRQTRKRAARVAE